MLFALGRLPGGSHFYRTMTRRYMGTQATHVGKLQRVWPAYVKVWTERCGLKLEGLDIWSFEGGWTPYPALASFLLTGKGGVTTNFDARVQQRYVAHAVEGALALAVEGVTVPIERRERVVSQGTAPDIASLYQAIGARLEEGIHPDALQLEDCSMDLCHSGGVLEHFRPDELRAFLKEAYRILRPGGVMSHVFDHRDHLHHADRKRPFLAHLGYSPRAYNLLFGHPLGYHSRLLPHQVVEMLGEAGFEQIAIRRMILPERSYVEGEDALRGKQGIDRCHLHRTFKDATDADLRTAAAHYLFRKPLA